METDGDTKEEVVLNFHEMELDDRILKAVAKLGWQKPTPVQEKAIPLLLEGKDVLMRARTGSGKTGAFVVPAVQLVLRCKQLSTSEQQTLVVILAPSRELCAQIQTAVRDITAGCAREVRSVDAAAHTDPAAAAPLLLERPDMVVATPGCALQHIRAGRLNLKNSLQLLVVDEADLLFSFGYEEELKQLLQYLPKIYQAVLASATLSEDVRSLKTLILRNPVTLRLNEPELPADGRLAHYQLSAEESDKAAILCALFKLRLLRGKTVVFVRTVDRCYKLKLFLEQFAVATCVLNSELPARVRCHAVEQFNKGLYDVLIASDELSLEAPAGNKSEEKKLGKRRRDRESGVSRGVDFRCVSNVLNFDFPADAAAYVHRAGRTARGDAHGSVLSLVSARERPMLEEVSKRLGEAVPMRVYQFKLEEVEPFRYRAMDAWRAATRVAVREARLKEIRQELLNCRALKGHFEDNPADMRALRHDRALRTVRVQPQLADVPEYAVPPALKHIAGVGGPGTGKRRGAKRQAPNERHVAPALERHRRNQNNPLIAMNFQPKKKKKIT